MKSILTEPQKAFIRQHYDDMTDNEIAKELGLTNGIIRSFRTRNRLRKSKAGILHAYRYRAAEYQKGHAPFNKGMKQTDYMTPEGIERSKKGRFKKGLTPHNAHEMNHIEKRGKYNFIKVRTGHGAGNMVLHHRYIYEQHYGKIPEDSMVIFKDGNTDNMDIENLQLITKAELMAKNSNNKYPNELVQMMKAIARAERELKKAEKNERI